MKKILTLLITIVTLFSFMSVHADEQHVIIDNYDDYMTFEQYDELNFDLQHVRTDYDIDIYFVFDENIEDSDQGVSSFAKNFLEERANSTNNVAIVVGRSYYSVYAIGTASDIVMENEDEIFSSFYSVAKNISEDPDAFYKGILASYQKVVSLVNSEVYHSDAPISAAKALVNDFSDLLTDSEEEKLNVKLQKIREKYGFDVVVTTTDSFNGMSAQDYADDLYDYSQYSDDGIIFVLNMEERIWYVSTKGTAIDYFTDYGIDEIWNAMSDDILDGKYYDAFVVYANKTEQYIVNGINGDIIDVDNQEKHFEPYHYIVSLVTGAIVSLVTTISLKSRMKNTSHQTAARNYIVNNSFKVTGASDMLVNRRRTRTPIPRDDGPSRSGSSSSSGGGGSSTHTSSSGSSHGGHGGHF